MTRARIITGCLVFMVLSQACSRDRKPPAESLPAVVSSFESFPREGGRLVSDCWYAVGLQEKPAGSQHVTVRRYESPRGLRRVVEAREVLSLRRGADQVRTTSTERTLEDDRGRLLRLYCRETEAGGDPVVVQAGTVGSEMITLRGPEVSRQPVDPSGLGSLLPYPWVLLGTKPKPADEIQFRTYERLTGGYSGNRLKIIALPAGDRGFIVEQTSDAMPGVVQRITLDPDFIPERIDTRMGSLRLTSRRVEGKPPDAPAKDLPDLSPLMQIETNVDFPSRKAVVRARYRIDGLPDFIDESWLTGPGQKVIGHPMRGTWIVESARLGDFRPAAFPLGETAPALKLWREATALAQSDDPGIVATAREVTAGAPDAWSAARRLRAWVSDNVSSNMGMGFAPASEVFRRREGDCSEQSVLLVALARAVGIPARCVMGLVYSNHSFARHMWTEAWIGEWRPLDPAMGTDHISAAWIRLGVHSLRLTGDRRTGMGGMLAFASALKISVLSHQTETD